MRWVIVFCAISLAAALKQDLIGPIWWKRMSLYQIYPRSFKDSDGDGIGDLKGITSKLDHLLYSNVDAFWLSPIYPSPMVDFGYDISDFLGIDPVYGTMEDFEELVKAAHDIDMKVIMDLVPNHSSDQHEWFQKSLKKIDPYTDYYVWHEGKVLENGTVTVPNNWVSVFGGPQWTWREERQAYYLHQFAPEQPDLNFNNEHVIREINNVMRFWLNKGVDGFRVDAIPHLCEDDRFLDEPLSGHTDDPNNYGYTEKIYTKDQPRTYEMVKIWREVLDEYKTEKDERIMMMEAYANLTMTMKYYNSGAHFPFNFGLITDLNQDSSASDFKNVIDGWMTNMPSGAVANWVAGNHDRPRLVSRFGYKKAQAVSMLTLLLPGVGVTYNGEEIGMENTWISWEDTKDPQGCNAGKEGYETASRDPARTPFQWDDTTSAGFSTNPETWLPMNENYKTLNLAMQKDDANSYYFYYFAMSQLKRSPVVTGGNLVTKLMNDNVFGFVRENHQGIIYALMNFADEEQKVDLSIFNNIQKEIRFYFASTDSGLIPGARITDYTKVKVPASGAAVYYSLK